MLSVLGWLLGILKDIPYLVTGSLTRWDLFGLLCPSRVNQVKSLILRFNFPAGSISLDNVFMSDSIVLF